MMRYDETLQVHSKFVLLNILKRVMNLTHVTEMNLTKYKLLKICKLNQNFINQMIL